jgi:anticodon-binding protein
VIEELAKELETSPPLTDRETFRAMARRVQQSSGAKGKGLFHPIRLALTGEAEGIELDIAVPAIDRGALVKGRPEGRPLPDVSKPRVEADLQVGLSGLRRILSARERAFEFAAALRSLRPE